MISGIYGGAVALRLPIAVYKVNYKEIHYTALDYKPPTQHYRKVPECTALASRQTTVDRHCLPAAGSIVQELSCSDLIND